MRDTPVCDLYLLLHAQVNMQALVLVSLFRQQTRVKVMEWIEWCLPDRIPWLWDALGHTATPAQVLLATNQNITCWFHGSVQVAMDRSFATHFNCH